VADAGNSALSADIDPGQARLGAWERYWGSGALHSCCDSFAGNYGDAIGAFWRQRFDALHTDARVLDVATGNGALPRLLLESRSNTPIECDAVDAAPIAPHWVQALPASERQRVRFHGSTPMEALPFPDRCFDLITSQYGLEYSDTARSCAEMRRVARRGAVFALVVHHRDSRPVALATNELEHIEWLVQSDGLLDTTELLLEPFERARTLSGREALSRDTVAIRHRERFNGLQRELTDRAAGAPCPDVLHETRLGLAGVLEQASQQGAAAAADRMRSLREGLRDSAVRLADLVRCALDAGAVAALASQLTDPSGVRRSAEVSTISASGHLMGWTLVTGLSGDT
jgi:SAM-dependent methyltransferase